MTAFNDLNSEIVACRKCPRLNKYCQSIAKSKKRAFKDQLYWGKPVPNFGDPRAIILIIGLAPAAHGGNRTGRMFTGDRSGDWLYRALYKAGLANQPNSTAKDDGLKLKDCMITAVIHCAPPANKPTPKEIDSCHYFLASIQSLTSAKVYIALGQIAWNELLKVAKEKNWYAGKKPPFKHLQLFRFSNGSCALASYHPSQQNTFTGKLTEQMFDDVFKLAKEISYNHSDCHQSQWSERR